MQIPTDLCDHPKYANRWPNEINYNLRTSDYCEAKRRGGNLLDELENEFTAFRNSFVSHFTQDLLLFLREVDGKLKGGNQIGETGHYWVPLFMLFHGCRLNEIAQVAPEDMDTEADIPFPWN